MNDKQTVIEYWLTSSKDDLDSAEHLFKAGKYHHALFFGHLALEKRLKAEIVEATDYAAPPIHILERLAQKTTIQFSSEQIESLTEITKFNLEARYDEYKFTFYKIATKDFAQQWIQKVKDLLEWINQHSILKS